MPKFQKNLTRADIGAILAAAYELLQTIDWMRGSRPDGGEEFEDEQVDAWFGPFEMSIDDASLEACFNGTAGSTVCWPSLQIDAERLRELVSRFEIGPWGWRQREGAGNE